MSQRLGSVMFFFPCQSHHIQESFMFIRELSTKMTFWAGVLLMFGAYMVTAQEFPLDMANKAVDDMYDGCADQMLELVKNGLLNKEKKENKNFRDAWNDAEENCKWKRKFKEEAEILIPPYEVFRVTKIETRAEDKKLPCEVVYTVKSTKIPVSNYNCALFKSSLSHG
ncbi:hypothetical protein OJAV_G00001210 [Oryzias javanicus]|uniref:NAD(P)(+)--arginine ADP-ribosyltransferase n=1 Tax=Oryzias javanicus TaxID=123683 RepID=A0A437DL86_ORYJA|nr:hypothetical protein OJAV_G00001210 [Oryzias javanicus]